MDLDKGQDYTLNYMTKFVRNKMGHYKSYYEIAFIQHDTKIIKHKSMLKKHLIRYAC